MPRIPVKRKKGNSLESGPVPGFGQRLEAARKVAGLTQPQLGERIGRSLTAVNEWENDKRPPDGGHMMVRLAATLGVSVDYLLTGREPTGIAAIITELERALAVARRIQSGGHAVDDEPSPLRATEVPGEEYQPAIAADPSSRAAGGVR